MEPLRREGELPSGSRYVIEVPDPWNGILLLCCRPLPQQPGEPPWGPGEPLLSDLLQEGFALAGSANTIFWPLQRCFADQAPLLEEFDAAVARPSHTIAWGPSIGGIMTAGLVQVMPERLSGALPLCGNLAGAVAVHNRELDIAFVLSTLLAPDNGPQLVHIRDPEANYAVADAMVQRAKRSPEGRARLGLAAAIGNIPGWYDPGSPEPAPDDVDARLHNQVAWLDEPGCFVYFAARAQVELQSGGNPSWNAGVDYRELLAGSIGRDLVEPRYERAGLDLSGDLATLAGAPRVDADPQAVAYLERHIVFTGQLGGLPVLALHTDGDGLVTPDNSRAYADVVGWAGNDDLLRRAYVHRGGHCTFTTAEVITALGVLTRRVETGSWPNVDPGSLNAAAADLPGKRTISRTDQVADPGFVDFEPGPFPRRYDVRETSAGG